MKERTKFVLGAPLSRKHRRPALERMQEDPPSLQAHLLSVYLNRVTDKTSGVLAIAGVVFAISMFVLDKTGKSDDLTTRHLTASAIHFALFFCLWGIFFSTATIFALCLNLTTVWRARLNPTSEDIEAIFHLFCDRAIRLQLSLYGIAIAAFFSVVALGVLELDLIADLLQAMFGAIGHAFSQAMSLMSRLVHRLP